MAVVMEGTGVLWTDFEPEPGRPQPGCPGAGGAGAGAGWAGREVAGLLGVPACCPGWVGGQDLHSGLSHLDSHCFFPLLFCFFLLQVTFFG